MAFVLSEMNDPWGEEEPRSELMIKDEIAPFQILSRDLISATGHLEPFTEKELARQARNGHLPDGVGILNGIGSEEDLSETLYGSERSEAAQTGFVGRLSTETHGYMRPTGQRQDGSVQNERKRVMSGTTGQQSSSIPRRSVDRARQSKPTVQTNMIPTQNVQDRDGPSPAQPTRSKSIGSSPITPKGSIVRTNSQTPIKTSQTGVTPSSSRTSPPNTTTTKNRQNSRSRVSPPTNSADPSSKRRPAKSGSISRQAQPDSGSPMTPDGSYRLSMFDEFSVPPSSSSPPTKNELRNWDEVVIPTVRKNLKINPLSEWQDPLPISPSHRRLAQISQVSQTESGTPADGPARKEESFDLIEMNDFVDRPINDGTDRGTEQASRPSDHKALPYPPLSSSPSPLTRATTTTTTAVDPIPPAQMTPALDSLGATIGNDGSVSLNRQRERVESLSHMNGSQPYRSSSSDQVPSTQAQAQNREGQYVIRSGQNVASNTTSGEIGTKQPEQSIDRSTGKGGGKGGGRSRGGGDEEVKGGCAACAIM
ncbi:hypothetical protein [Phaffia rhodozyma]|uniref:Uncharacterized protein n=1 Tax=Phaffia rhodozyma TaxID=264483 RepID=A0A0F7SLT7_PHARH|nr:hypothetical protein [Phaffia rhodozyma]